MTRESGQQTIQTVEAAAVTLIASPQNERITTSRSLVPPSGCARLRGMIILLVILILLIGGGGFYAGPGWGYYGGGGLDLILILLLLYFIFGRRRSL